MPSSTVPATATTSAAAMPGESFSAVASVPGSEAHMNTTTRT